MDIHGGHMDIRLDIHRISTGYPKDRFVDIFLGTRSQKSNLSVFNWLLNSRSSVVTARHEKPKVAGSSPAGAKSFFHLYFRWNGSPILPGDIPRLLSEKKILHMSMEQVKYLFAGVAWDVNKAVLWICSGYSVDIYVCPCGYPMDIHGINCAHWVMWRPRLHECIF